MPIVILLDGEQKKPLSMREKNRAKHVNETNAPKYALTAPYTYK